MLRLYTALVIDRPWTVLAVLLLLAAAAVWGARDFRLDASSDSLVVETDPDLAYYRQISDRYGTSDFLIVTYTPPGPMLGEASLDTLERLVRRLEQVEGVASVLSILEVPLLPPPDTPVSELAERVTTLSAGDFDREQALRELTTNPLYRNLIISPNGEHTAIQVNLPADTGYTELVTERRDLLTKQEEEGLTDTEQERLATVQGRIDEMQRMFSSRQDELVAEVRDVVDEFRGEATMHLAGLPMIAVDMLRFVGNDIQTFGIGVLVMVVVALAYFFRRVRWVVLPIACAGVTVLYMVGLLGAIGWPVTVISSNFVSLLMIISIALTIHLIVRYRELLAGEGADLDVRGLVRETVRHRFPACFYTAVTTMVAFASLVTADIVPVVDFGWMMTLGVAVALLVAFTLFPAVLMLLPRGAPASDAGSGVGATAWLGRLTTAAPKGVLGVAAVVAVVAGWGVSRLSVENSFIDYFGEDTEIYRGMQFIDEQLGGTTPLDVLIDFSAPSAAGAATADEPAEAADGEDPFADPFAEDFTGGDAASQTNGGQNGGGDPFAEDFAGGDGSTGQAAGGDGGDPFADPFTEPSAAGGDAGQVAGLDRYWFTPAKIDLVEQVHEYVDAQPETGKVLSLATLHDIAKRFNDGQDLSAPELAVVIGAIPQQFQETLLAPYAAPEADQARISVRMIESNRDLDRDAFLERVHDHVAQDIGLGDDRVHLTGMMVLFNNMLQSLFTSQLTTLFWVAVGILITFIALFRSLVLGLLALVPNGLAAGSVLGFMGIAGLPLDMMTITIAAIVIGIGVDGTIHYVDRMKRELPDRESYSAAIHASHGSIGHAIYYTTVTIIAGFSILAASNFTPTIYFGVMTAVSMALALLANLTLLPALLLLVRPLGQPGAARPA